MQYRHLFPVVRLLLPFAAGISICVFVEAIAPVPFFIIILLFAGILSIALLPTRSYGILRNQIFGFLTSLFLLFIGYNSVINHKEILSQSHFANQTTKGALLAEIIEPLQAKEHSFKTILQVKGIINGNKISVAEGKILTYFSKDTLFNPVEEGCTIILEADISEIAPPVNPGSFDYRKYMAANNVYHQVYLKSYNWRLLAPAEGFSLIRFAHKVSRKFVNILNKSGLEGREFAVGSALMLGQSDMLDFETLQAYSGSGAMHILSVSGLHVGIIFLVISFLLGFMKKSGWQLFLKTVLILGTVWAYALLSGFSPSVLRAAAMFTFISIGNASNRNVHIVNSLAVSAFVLLYINPLMISNVGFQLSYLAIAGIVFINEPLSRLVNPGNRITAYIWELTAVSISAQLATAPLAMYYFHQFPLYFIPANIFAVPVSFLAMYSGLAVLATSFMPIVSQVFGAITNFFLYILNYSIFLVEDLPYSVLPVTSIFSIEMILLYAILLSTILYFSFRNKKVLYAGILITLILALSLSYTSILRKQQKRIIFYSSGKQSACGFVNGREQTLMADSILLNNRKTDRFQFEGTRNLFGIDYEQRMAIDTLLLKSQLSIYKNKEIKGFRNYLFFENIRIVLLDSIASNHPNPTKLKVDYIVLRQNPKIRIEDITRLFSFGTLVIDGSNSYSRTSKWIEDCKKNDIEVNNLRNGAVVIDL